MNEVGTIEQLVVGELALLGASDRPEAAEALKYARKLDALPADGDRHVALAYVLALKARLALIHQSVGRPTPLATQAAARRREASLALVRALPPDLDRFAQRRPEGVRVSPTPENTLASGALWATASAD